MSEDEKFIAGRDDGHVSDHPDAPFRRHDDYGHLTRRGEEMLQGAASAATTFGGSGGSSAYSEAGFGLFLIAFWLLLR